MIPLKLGILAGGGPLPILVAESVTAQGGKVFIVGFEGFVDPNLIAQWPHGFYRLAAAGQIIRALRDAGCRDIVLIGPVKRPALRDLKPDKEGARLLARMGRAVFAGDDGLLGAIVRVLGEEGFNVRGAHEFLAQALGPKGVLTRLTPSADDAQDISRAVKVVKALGRLDIGQGCVVQSGLVLAVEALEGTDAMLQRCAALRQPGPGGILLKMLKPGQERRADMPTIGPRTVQLAAESGLAGIAYQADGVLFTDLAQCVAEANARRLFLMGIEPL
ncbi:MAG: UDP-2,3-diacylglucosamine diphosphatase LpxI [Acetobacteraceae bacterium]